MNYQNEIFKNLLISSLKITQKPLFVFTALALIVNGLFIPQRLFAIAPVITWANPNDIVYGVALSATELNATTNVDGVFVYTPALGTVLNAGVGQTLSVTFTPTDIINYEIETTEVLINVAKAPLWITVEDKTKESGTPDPIFTYTYSGLVNGDTEAVFSGALERDPGELANSYDINQGTLSAGSNYTTSGRFIVGALNIKDTIAPTVVSHTPSSDASNVSPSTSIVVTFSEAVNIEEGGYVLFNPRIPGGFTINNSGTSVVTITPRKPLANDTTYIMTIQDIEDINGTPFTTYDVRFTTAPTPLPASGGGGGGIPPVVPGTPPQKADINKDNKVDVLDFNALMVNWGNSTPNNVADFNSDGQVDLFDFNLLMINWTL